MPEAKTKPTDANVSAYLAARAGSDEQRADAQALITLLTRLTGEPATMP